jgi:hypothetical protein
MPILVVAAEYYITVGGVENGTSCALSSAGRQVQCQDDSRYQEPVAGHVVSPGGKMSETLTFKCRFRNGSTRSIGVVQSGS